MCITAAAVLGGGAILGGVAQGVLGSRGASAQANAARDAASAQLAMFDTNRADMQPWQRSGGNALAQLNYELGLAPERPNNLFIAPGQRDFYRGMNDMRAITAELDKMNKEGRYNDPRYQQLIQRRDMVRWGIDPDARAGGFEETPGYAFRVGEGQKAIERSAAARGGLNSGATMKALQRFGQGIAAEEYGTYLNRLGAMSGTGQVATQNLGSMGQAAAGQAGNALMQAGNARASGYQAVGNALTGTIGQGVGIAALSGAFSPRTPFAQNPWDSY
jgi:hypothetical protein